MDHPLHLALDAFDPKEWTFLSNSATHRSGSIVLGDFSTTSILFAIKTPHDQVEILAEYSAAPSSSMKAALRQLAKRVSLKPAKALQTAVCLALLDKTDAVSWKLQWDNDTIYATSYGRGQSQFWQTPHFRALLPASLYQQILSFQNTSLPNDTDPLDMQLHAQKLFVAMPQTQHERLELLARFNR